MHLILAFDPAALTLIDTPADVVVFPELVTGGYAALESENPFRKPGDRDVQAFRLFSRELRTTCIAGSIAIQNPRGKPSNTTLVFNKGRQVLRYDKIHLFRPAGDDRHFRPGIGFRGLLCRRSERSASVQA